MLFSFCFIYVQQMSNLHNTRTIYENVTIDRTNEVMPHSKRTYFDRCALKGITISPSECDVEYCQIAKLKKLLETKSNYVSKSVLFCRALAQKTLNNLLEIEREERNKRLSRPKTMGFSEEDKKIMAAEAQMLKERAKKGGGNIEEVSFATGCFATPHNVQQLRS